MKKFLTFALVLAMLSLTMFAAVAEEKTTLTVALSPDFAPMEFVDTSKSGQDQYVGFDVTLAKYLAQEMGLELEIQAMSFDACQTAVQVGSVDMSISGFSKTDERAENFLLSDFYQAGDNETQQVIIVKADKAGTFKTAEDFAGMVIGCQDASLQYNLCSTQLPETCELKLFKAIDDAVLSLMTGKVDAVAVADGNADAIIANNDAVAKSGFEFDVADDQKDNVILLNKNSTELLAKVNEILAKAKAEGLYAGWYAEAKELAGIETAAEISIEE